MTKKVICPECMGQMFHRWTETHYEPYPDEDGNLIPISVDMVENCRECGGLGEVEIDDE